MTNFEKIKQMDIDEMANALATINNAIFQAYLQAAVDNTSKTELIDAMKVILEAEVVSDEKAD